MVAPDIYKKMGVTTEDVDQECIDDLMLQVSERFKIGSYNGDNPAEAAWYGDYPKMIQLIING